MLGHLLEIPVAPYVRYCCLPISLPLLRIRQPILFKDTFELLQDTDDRSQQISA
jgi:hypothetical protein